MKHTILRSIILISFSVLLTFQTSNGQQLFKITQFTEGNFISNPAAAGANGSTSVGLAYRKMWSGMPGGPVTSLVFGDAYFSKMKTGVGVVVYSDKTGPTSRTGGQLDVSYSIEFNNDKRLMFGLAGTCMQYQVDPKVNEYLAGENISSGSQMVGDAAAGVYYRSSTLNIGFAVQQLIQSKLQFLESTTNSQGKLYRHYFIGGHYNIKVDEMNTIIPNLSVNLVENIPAEVQAGVKLQHKDLIWVGYNYRYALGFSAMAGCKIMNRLSIGYAYDQYNTPLSVFEDGGDAHEIMLTYSFK